MKKIVLVSFFSVFMLSFSIAQKGAHVGVHGSFNSVFIMNQNNYGYSEMDYDLKLAPLFGAEAGYNFNENSGVQLEINFAKMGQDYSDNIRDFTDPKKTQVTRTVAISYLQIPILYRYTVGENNLKFHVLLGPQFGFLSSAKQEYMVDKNFDGTLEAYPDAPEPRIPQFAAEAGKEADKNYFQKTDVGIQLDFGVDYYITENIYLTAAIKSYYGFTDINSEPTRNLDPSGYGASKNAYAGINIGVHYFLPMK